jgi:hypothetical protein
VSATEELYQAGNRLYQERSYAAAEAVFRQMCDAVPPEGKEAGRAHYSLALCLLHLDRTGEARQALNQALRADPGLERAKDRLREIDAAQAAPPPPAGPPDRAPAPPASGGSGPIMGTATKIRRSTTGSPWIARATNSELAFRLVVSSGATEATAVAVALHGPRILGSVEDGDQIQLPAGWRPGVSPSQVLNLTTGETVRVASGGRVVQWVILAVFLIAFAAFAIWVASNLRSDSGGFQGLGLA